MRFGRIGIYTNSARGTRLCGPGRERIAWFSPYLLAVALSPMVLQSSTPLSCEKTGDTTLSLLQLEVSGQEQIAFYATKRNYDVWLPVSAGAATLRASLTDPAGEIGYQLRVAGEFIEGGWVGSSSEEVVLNLPLGRSTITILVKASRGAVDYYYLNVSVGCSECDDGNDCTTDTCNTAVEICVHQPTGNGAACNFTGLIWTDSIQSGEQALGLRRVSDRGTDR